MFSEQLLAMHQGKFWLNIYLFISFQMQKKHQKVAFFDPQSWFFRLFQQLQNIGSRSNSLSVPPTFQEQGMAESSPILTNYFLLTICFQKNISNIQRLLLCQNPSDRFISSEFSQNSIVSPYTQCFPMQEQNVEIRKSRKKSIFCKKLPIYLIS